ncbi:alanine--tRNA ligase [Fodinicola acaciae]|uniref:alanine--tRNA ligase n=1 Tax=Fodinicola acaciae TaxID=2681555 RepID=UPI0013D42332|nr:alanine--tRNA ligase [Fodinicola acaciae]
MRTAEIRRRFLDHFVQRGHTEVPSASLILDDPNLLFVNAGMVQFKPYFLGQQTPPYTRATSVQKCIRTGDIDEVGKTTRHGTFFQMNGNFSFGDYFKEGAIEHAWELITGSQDAGGLGFDPDRIWVTVYLDDDEASDLWKKIAGLPEERIQRRGKADNFWSMGIPGPCGPCSEIYIDRGAEYGPDGGPVVDEDRFLEIWNLVFMQYERGEGSGKEDYEILGELPARNIDTGMGLERAAYLLQGVDNLYEIDEVYPVLQRAAELAGCTYGKDHTNDVHLRVIADHVRSGLMLIGDGVSPGNEGRGYVLRRLLRRSVRAMRLLGYDKPALPELLPISKDLMKASYPELETGFDRISQIAYGEEDAFRRTLAAGTTILDTAVETTKKAGGKQLSGGDAFKLHDTYGFPIDLTLEMAEEQGLKVDEDGFRRLMTEQRERARADARAKKTGHADTSLLRAVLDQHGPTDWQAYTTLETESKVLALISGADGVPAAGQGEIVQLILDRTPLYAESGGQNADAGVIEWDGGSAEVLDVQRPLRGLVVHQVRITDGELTVDAAVRAKVDPEWRLGACQAHSGTHVMHAALRQVLGPSALQSGSYNRPGYLRLDFAWKGALDQRSRHDIEDVANLAVRRDLPVSATYMPLTEAREIGAIALFGETYNPEKVRVVQIGPGQWSIELCGGTHVQSSSQIGPLVLTGESSVGSSSRRVEAVVGIEAFRYLAKERDLVSQLAEILKSPRDNVADRVESMVTRLRDAEKELARMRAAAVLSSAGELASGAEDLDGVAYVATETPEGTGGGDIRKLAQEIRGRLDPGRPGVVAVAGATDGKASLVVAITKAAKDSGLSAADLVRGALGGKGGGNADLAQGGGVAADQLRPVLDSLRQLAAARGAT